MGDDGVTREVSRRISAFVASSVGASGVRQRKKPEFARERLSDAPGTMQGWFRFSKAKPFPVPPNPGDPRAFYGRFRLERV